MYARLKIITSLLIISLVTIDSYSQRSYANTDSSSMIGVRIITGTKSENSEFVIIQKHGKTTKYTPDQITEFGINRNSIYRSREIEIDGEKKKVFLKVIEDGEYTLYQYSKNGKDYFVLENPKSNLTLLSKESYKDDLTGILTNNITVSENIKYSKYNSKYFGHLTYQQNNEDFKSISLPNLYVSAGANTTRSEINNVSSLSFIDNFSVKSGSNFTVGAFVDIPLGYSNFSINTGLTYSSAKFSGIELGNSISTGVLTETKYKIDVSSVTFPTLIRFKFSNHRLSPFLNLGLSTSYQLTNTSEFKILINDGNTFKLSEFDDPVYSKIMIGMMSGAGIQYRLNPKRVIYLETRYCSYSGSKNDVIKSELNFLLGITIL